MNILGQEILKSFVEKKSRKTFGGEEEEGKKNDKPLLVKDIRAKMSKEILRIMRHNNMKKNEEKKIKEMLDHEILSMVRNFKQNSFDRKSVKSKQSKSTEKTYFMLGPDPVIVRNLPNDVVNFQTIGDAKIDLPAASKTEQIVTIQPKGEGVDLYKDQVTDSKKLSGDSINNKLFSSDMQADSKMFDKGSKDSHNMRLAEAAELRTKFKTPVHKSFIGMDLSE